MSAHASACAEPAPQRFEAIAVGAEPEIVGPYLAQVLHDPRWRQCSVALISGGKSNLTYTVSCDAGEVVLRRPPLGHVLPTAHDMAREYRVQSALRGSQVPVPRMLHLAGSADLLGAPFYVMERVVGHVCRDQLPRGYGETASERAAVGRALIDTLAHLHATDPVKIGLADFGRGTRFMERQLGRWSRQWASSKVADLPALEALRDRLAGTIPEQTAVAIVHGDYRLDNTVLHPASPGEIVAVLDWEMSTLGDPLADLGGLLAYWSEPGDDIILEAARITPPVTTTQGFPSRSEIVRCYADITGFDVPDIAWYWAFAYLKLAVVCQGVAARAGHGAMLGPGFEDAQTLVEPLVLAGHHVLDDC